MHLHHNQIALVSITGNQIFCNHLRMLLLLYVSSSKAASSHTVFALWMDSQHRWTVGVDGGMTIYKKPMKMDRVLLLY